MYYVYILRCADDTLYTGYTPDLTARLAELMEPQAAPCANEAPSRELAAYRRAEAAERNAYLRARHIYRRLEEIEASVRSAAEGCGSQSAILRERISDASRQMEELTAALCSALQDAGAQLENLEPTVAGHR